MSNLDDVGPPTCFIFDANAFREAIWSGRMDANLEQMKDIIFGRIQVIKEIGHISLFATLSVGDKVKFNSKVHPKYLRGVEGVVDSKKTKKVVIRLNDGPEQRKFIGRFSNKIVCPVSLLERI